MTEKTVSFKMPEDEVADLDQEADEEGKTRSAYIRSVLRARHIEEQLEEQVLTEADKRRYENRIDELERQRNEYNRDLEIAQAKLEAMDETIDETVRDAVGPIRGEYETQINELKEENERLREGENDELRRISHELKKQTKELVEANNEIIEEIPSEQRVDAIESSLTELLEEKADRQWEGTTEQRELVMELRDEIRDELQEEVRHARPLTVKALDWIRRRLR